MARMAQSPDPHGSTDDRGVDGGHDDHVGHDDHERGDAMALGPIDVPRWGAAALGVLLGLVIVLALIQSLS
jgi:hypothetical protein